MIGRYIISHVKGRLTGTKSDGKITAMSNGSAISQDDRVVIMNPGIINIKGKTVNRKALKGIAAVVAEDDKTKRRTGSCVPFHFQKNMLYLVV
jgi:hypothetical protein